jgi:hypothetical protein
MKSLCNGYRIAISIVTLGILAGFPAMAHHSGVAYFDLEVEIIQHDATVVEYVLVNPHGRLTYTFTDEAGVQQEWTGELASSNNLRRLGLGGEILKPGDKLKTVTGSPARSGTNFMRLSRVDFENGDVAQLVGPNAGITRSGE